MLASRPTARDIKIEGFTLGLNGSELIQDCNIELTIGRRYGLLGQNGSGKSNFLKCIAKREVGAGALQLAGGPSACSQAAIPNQSNMPGAGATIWDSPVVPALVSPRCQPLQHACCHCLPQPRSLTLVLLPPSPCPQVPIPDHLDIYHLDSEAEPSDRTALEAVVDHIKAELERLQAFEEEIMTESGPEDERLEVRGAAVGV